MSVTRVHHVSCATMCPLASRLVNEHRHLVAHALVVETASDGLVLVDSGFGLRDVADPTLLAWSFRKLAGPRLAEADTARRQIEALGFAAETCATSWSPTSTSITQAVCPTSPAPSSTSTPPSSKRRATRATATSASATTTIKSKASSFAPTPRPATSCSASPRFASSMASTPTSRWFRLANRKRLGEVARAHAGEVDVFSAHDPSELARLADRERVARDRDAS